MGLVAQQISAGFASVVRRERAEALLQRRTQLAEEKVAIFTEDMVRLFRHADPDVIEEKKSFPDEGCQARPGRRTNSQPTDDSRGIFIGGTAIEKTLGMRTRQYDRRMVTLKYELQGLGNDDIPETILASVHEDLQRTFPKSQPQVASIAAVVPELQRALGVRDVQPQSPRPSRKR